MGFAEIKRVLQLYFLVMVIASAALVTSCRSSNADGVGTVDLSGDWTMVERSDDGPASFGYDDSNAQKVGIPGSWANILQKNKNLEATFWLRKKFTAPEELSQELMVLSLGNFGVADRAWINGTCIGGMGEFPKEGAELSYRSAWHRARVYQFPASLLKAGRENLVAVKVYTHVINGVQDNPAVHTIGKWNRTHWLHEYLPSLKSLEPLLLSFILLMLLLIIGQGMVDRKVGIYAMLFISCVFCVNLLVIGLPRFIDNMDRYRYFLAFYAMTDYMLLLLMQEFFNIKSRLLIMITSVMLTGIIIFIAAVPDTRFLINYGGPATAGAIIVYITAAMSLFLIALKRDPRRYWYLAFWVVLILASVYNTLRNLITGEYYLFSFTFAIRMPLLLLAAVVVYIFDLKKSKKERDSLTRALLQKTKELKKAQRAMPRNVKPEPRDTIHEVVEYLDANFNETYDRKALARQFGLNDDYMGQLFKKVTGTNIANYINSRRIEASMQLLRETDSKVIDIAFHVGFDNLTYFYRHFKKHTGYSPVEYRQVDSRSDSLRRAIMADADEEQG